MCLTETPYKDHNWGRSCKSQKGWTNLERANSDKYNLLTSCATNHHSSWSAAAFVFTFVTVVFECFALCFCFVVYCSDWMGVGGGVYGQRPELNTGKQMNALYESSSKLLEKNKTGLHCVLLTCKTSMIHQELNLIHFHSLPIPNVFSLTVTYC